MKKAAPPDPLLTGRPWEVLGLSRSRWFKLFAEDPTVPRRVSIRGTTRNFWRTADLRAWADKLASRRN